MNPNRPQTVARQGGSVAVAGEDARIWAPVAGKKEQFKIFREKNCILV